MFFIIILLLSGKYIILSSWIKKKTFSINNCSSRHLNCFREFTFLILYKTVSFEGAISPKYNRMIENLSVTTISRGF